MFCIQRLTFYVNSMHTCINYITFTHMHHMQHRKTPDPPNPDHMGEEAAILPNPLCLYCVPSKYIAKNPRLHIYFEYVILHISCETLSQPGSQSTKWCPGTSAWLSACSTAERAVRSGMGRANLGFHWVSNKNSNAQTVDSSNT